MRRLFGWMAGLAGIAALARVLSRRAASSRSPAPQEDPADALREKLSESRARQELPEEPPVQAPPEPEETLDERRARVHAKAQEAIDAMQETERPDG